MKRAILALSLLAILFTIGCSGVKPEKEDLKSEELKKAETMISDSEPYKQLVLDEVKLGNLTAQEIEIYKYAKNQYELYIAQNSGNYDSDLIDPKVTEDTAKKFNISGDDGINAFLKVDALIVGLKPEESVKLNETNIPVSLTVDRISLNAKKELEIELTNNTEIDTLPTMNISFNLYKDGEMVGMRVAWAENMKKGPGVYTTSVVDETFDSIDGSIYINIENMQTSNLKSTIQNANDRGETVISVYEIPMTKIDK